MTFVNNDIVIDTSCEVIMRYYIFYLASAHLYISIHYIVYTKSDHIVSFFSSDKV